MADPKFSRLLADEEDPQAVDDAALLNESDYFDVGATLPNYMPETAPDLGVPPPQPVLKPGESTGEKVSHTPDSPVAKLKSKYFGDYLKNARDMRMLGMASQAAQTIGHAFSGKAPDTSFYEKFQKSGEQDLNDAMAAEKYNKDIESKNLDLQAKADARDADMDKFKAMFQQREDLTNKKINAAKDLTERKIKAVGERPKKDMSIQERNTLQNQYDRDPEIRKNKEVFASFRDATQLVTEKSPAADLALIYAYMKALDPGSVVRESEAESTQAIGGLWERAKAKLASVAGEAGLTDIQRADLLKQIEKKAQSAWNTQSITDQTFRKNAIKRGVDPEDIRLVNAPQFAQQQKDSTAGIKNVDEDAEAMAWADANPKDPRAAKIKEMHSKKSLGAK